MEQIPLKAKVYCSGEYSGLSAGLIVDPVKQSVTHVVVEDINKVQRIVPIEHIQETELKRIVLSCSRAELLQMPEFTEVHYIQGQPANPYTTYTEGGGGGLFMEPFVANMDGDVTAYTTEKVPKGELAVHRGAQVNSTDGKVGTVGEFLLDSTDGHVTHLVLQTGHLWGKHDVAIPYSAVERLAEDVVYLNLTSAEVEALPRIDLKRLYGH